MSMYRRSFELDAYDRKVERLSLDVSGVDDPESDRFSRTQQSFKDDCDVNLIMKRFERTGILDHLNEFNGQYGDFTDLPVSYHDAVNQVLAAQDMFMTVPSAIRDRFGNDPGAFLAFVDNPANGQELIDMGLARPVEPVDPPPVVLPVGGEDLG